MIIIGVVGTGEKRHRSVLERLAELKEIGKDIQEVGRWLGDPRTSKAKYYREQLTRLRQDGFDGVVVFTNVMYHDEFLALAAKGGIMWHLVSSVSDVIPIRTGVDKLVSLFDTKKRPHYVTPDEALYDTLENGIER